MADNKVYLKRSGSTWPLHKNGGTGTLTNIDSQINSTLAKKIRSAQTVPVPRTTRIQGGKNTQKVVNKNFTLNYSNLKPNTKYKIFGTGTQIVQQGTLQSKSPKAYLQFAEEETAAFQPFGNSRKYNTHESSTWSYFVADNKGRLSIKIVPERLDIINSTCRSRSAYSNGCKSSTPAKTKFQQYAIVEFGKVVTDENNNSQIPIETKTTKVPNLIVCPPAPTPNSSKNQNRNSNKKVIEKAVPGFLQTFYVDQNVLEGSKTIDITDLTLFFRRKPEKDTQFDDVVVYLLDTDDQGNPDLESKYQNSIVSLPRTTVQSSSDATVGTTFNFDAPIRLEGNKYYAFGVEFHNKDYLLWSSKTGNALVGTSQASPGSSRDHKGDLYEITNVNKDSVVTNEDFVSKPIFDEDLKFEIHAAEYIVEDITFNFVNEDFEFIKIDVFSGDVLFSAGDLIYQETANSTGTITINAGEEKLVGTGTTFTGLTEGDRILLIDSSNNDITEIGVVDNVENDTILYFEEPVTKTISGNYSNPPTGFVYQYIHNNRELILHESDATSASYFQANGVLKSTRYNTTGTISSVNDFPVSFFNASFESDIPTNFNLVTKHNLSYDDNGTFRTSNSTNYEDFTSFEEPNYLTKYDALIMSRSNEVLNSSFLYNQDKSLHLEMTFDYQPEVSTTFESPEIDIDDFVVLVSRFFINDDENDPATRHISNVMTIGKEKLAEDVRAIYNAYRPVGTELKSYAKIKNPSDPDDFETKAWTELSLIEEAQFSKIEDRYDLVEMEFSFPDVPESNTTLNGVVDTETLNANNVVTGTGTSFTSELVAGDVIKIYSPLFDTNFGVFSVESVDSDTQITLSQRVTNNGIIDTGLKIDTLKNPYGAFLNPDNKNIVRYFDQTGSYYDGYYTLSVKTELFSDKTRIVPRVDDYRVIAISA